jgi:hypothetical protein
MKMSQGVGCLSRVWMKDRYLAVIAKLSADEETESLVAAGSLCGECEQLSSQPKRRVEM